MMSQILTSFVRETDIIAPNFPSAQQSNIRSQSIFHRKENFTSDFVCVVGLTELSEKSTVHFPRLRRRLKCVDQSTRSGAICIKEDQNTDHSTMKVGLISFRRVGQKSKLGDTKQLAIYVFHALLPHCRRVRRVRKHSQVESVDTCYF